MNKLALSLKPGGVGWKVDQVALLQEGDPFSCCTVLAFASSRKHWQQSVPQSVSKDIDAYDKTK